MAKRKRSSQPSSTSQPALAADNGGGRAGGAGGATKKPPAINKKKTTPPPSPTVVNSKQKKMKNTHSKKPTDNKKQKKVHDDDVNNRAAGEREEGAVWSKSKKKRMRQLRGKMKKRDSEGGRAATNTSRAKSNNDDADTTSSKKRRKQRQKENKKVTSGASREGDMQDNQGGDGGDEDVKQQRKKRSKKNDHDNGSAATALAGKKKSSPSTITLKVDEKADRTSTEISSPIIQATSKQQRHLLGSRFRILNEELYTTTSSTAYQRFTNDPTLYQQYHTGYRSQVEQWPTNPVDVIVKKIIRSSSSKNSNKTEKIVVSDFGCGDAELARQLLNKKKSSSASSAQSSSPFQVHSFDLVASDPALVTACDMAHVPIPDASVDIAVFCLSLMGTNFADFIREAHRVLRSPSADSRLHIAEVRSRFETSGKQKIKAKPTKKNHDDNEELHRFIKVLDRLGFDCINTDRSNKMFVLFEFKKNGKQPESDLTFTAKPCLYKRR